MWIWRYAWTANGYAYLPTYPHTHRVYRNVFSNFLFRNGERKTVVVDILAPKGKAPLVRRCKLGRLHPDPKKRPRPIRGCQEEVCPRCWKAPPEPPYASQYALSDFRTFVRWFSSYHFRPTLPPAPKPRRASRNPSHAVLVALTFVCLAGRGSAVVRPFAAPRHTPLL